MIGLHLFNYLLHTCTYKYLNSPGKRIETFHTHTLKIENEVRKEIPSEVRKEIPSTKMDLAW